MSNNNQYSSASYSYSSSSYSSFSSTNPTGTTTRFTQSTSTDPRGTRTHRTAEETGKRPYQETTYTPAAGRRLEAGTASAGTQGRIEDVTDDQAEMDRQYEERMEDEYAKREGGA